MNSDYQWTDPADDSNKCLIDDIQGRKVVAADGQIVGEVADLMINYATWQVDAVRVKVLKEVADSLGIPRGRITIHAPTIDLPVRMVQSVSDTVLLSVPTGQLRPGRMDQAAA